jgi:chromate transporter
LASKLLWLVAGISFIATFFLGIPFILVALALGAAAFAVRPELVTNPATPALQSVQLGRLIHAPKRVVAIGVSLLGLVALCVLAINIWTGSDTRWGSLAWVLLVSAYTLGGAYAIVDYASQEFVINYGWLSATDMSVGLGLGESTPGPLILVLEFASILAAATDPQSSLPLWLAGALAGLLAVFVLFATSTGIILSIAPFTDRLLASARLRQAMRVISAAVVGVLVSLGLSFAITTFFGEVELTRYGDLFQVLTPALDSIYWQTVLIGALAGVLLFRLRLPLWQVALISAGVGALVQ